MNPRTFTDRNGDEITVTECENGAYVHVEDRGAYAEAGDLPAIAAALYEAAGKPAPLILDGYEDAGLTCATIGGVRIYLAEGRKVGIDGTEDLPPALARQIARMLVSIAGTAETEPDPAEVEELAAIIREKIPGWKFFPGAKELAAHILRQWREREIAP